MPIFNRLGNQGFLEGCKNVSNQSASESFNNVLWSLCPKEQFNSPMAISFTVIFCFCLYKPGLDYTLTSPLRNAGLELDTSSHRQWRRMDKEGMRKGDYAFGKRERERETQT